MIILPRHVENEFLVGGNDRELTARIEEFDFNEAIRKAVKSLAEAAGEDFVNTVVFVKCRSFHKDDVNPMRKTDDARQE